LILRPSVRRSDEAFTRYDRRTDQSDRPVGPTIGTCKRPLINFLYFFIYLSLFKQKQTRGANRDYRQSEL